MGRRRCGRGGPAVGGRRGGGVREGPTGESIQALKEHTRNVNSVGFSPDGARIVTGNIDNAKVWDARTGAQQLELKGAGNVNGVAFSPDGARIVTGGSGATAKV